MRFLLALGALCALTWAEHRCAVIDDIFIKNAQKNSTTACRCFTDPSPAEPTDNIWLGCTGHSMPSIFKDLSSLNETMVSRLHVWDSILNIVPENMFEQVHPRVLIIERSMLSVVRSNGFGVIGTRLKELRLRNNILKKIDPNMLKGLDRLRVLDMSGNKLITVPKDSLNNVADLRELILNDNDIATIEDGAFSKLTSLRSLSLAENKITDITKDTFKGLDNLEYLHIQNNKIQNIDWAAFKHMKHLRHLDLGTNLLPNVELRGLDALQKLIINNNSLMSLKNVNLRDLTSLVMLNLDRNGIDEIDDSDLFGLALSTRIESLSLAANNISVITPRALSHVQHIGTLALQNNQLTSLSSNGQPILRSLKRLANLILSGNTISAIREGELPKSLRILAADHNQISHVDAKAFAAIPLHRIYLNSNRLAYLPKGSFDSFDMNSLEAVDIRDNAWQCVCGEEWVGSWLETFHDKDVGDGYLGCLAARPCGAEDKFETEEVRSKWVTITASVLAIVSIFILVAIAYLYVDDGRQKILVSRPFSKRIDSDLLKLINDNETIDAKTDAARGLQPRQRQDANNKKSVRFVPM